MVSATFVNELMAENTGQAYIELFTFEAEGEPTGYLANDVADFVSRGNTYRAASFKYIPAKLTGQELTQAKITISNVSRDLIGEIRKAHKNPTIIAELVAVSRPDSPEQTTPKLDIEDVTFTTQSIQANLAHYHKLFDQTYPAGSYTPGWFPGVFA